MPGIAATKSELQAAAVGRGNVQRPLGSPRLGSPRLEVGRAGTTAATYLVPQDVGHGPALPCPTRHSPDCSSTTPGACVESPMHWQWGSTIPHSPAPWSHSNRARPRTIFQAHAEVPVPLHAVPAQHPTALQPALLLWQCHVSPAPAEPTHCLPSQSASTENTVFATPRICCSRQLLVLPAWLCQPCSQLM